MRPARIEPRCRPSATLAGSPAVVVHTQCKGSGSQPSYAQNVAQLPPGSLEPHLPFHHRLLLQGEGGEPSKAQIAAERRARLQATAAQLTMTLAGGCLQGAGLRCVLCRFAGAGWAVVDCVGSKHSCYAAVAVRCRTARDQQCNAFGCLALTPPLPQA